MTWLLAEQIGYEPITTFWQDFSIADKFGKNAIKETAEKAFEEWKDDYKFLTELIMVINHKSWEYSNSNLDLCSFYSNLYYEYDEKAINYLEKKKDQEAISYYFKTLD